MSEETARVKKEFVDAPTAAAESKSKEFFRKLFKRKTALVAAIFIVILIIIALFGQYLTPYDPAAPDYVNALQGPSGAHVMGTDEYGRDVLSRLIAGTRLSLGVALSSVLVGAILGTILGLLSGYYGGVIEFIVMRSSDILLAFPDILLCIAIVAIIGPGVANIMIAIAVYTVPAFARMVRSVTLSTKETLYVEAARSLGARDNRILLRYIFPETAQTIIINFTMRIGSAILATASLSFLGFGANVQEPDWGAMLSAGRNYFGVAGHMLLFPGFVIFLTVLAFNLLGDGLRDALDPRMK